MCIELHLSALNSLTIGPPNYPMFAEIWEFMVLPCLRKSFFTGHASVSVPCQCFKVAGMPSQAGWPWKLRNWLSLDGGEKQWKKGSLGSRDTRGWLHHPCSCLQIWPSLLLPWTHDTFNPGCRPSSPMCCGAPACRLCSDGMRKGWERRTKEKK